MYTRDNNQSNDDDSHPPPIDGQSTMAQQQPSSSSDAKLDRMMSLISELTNNMGNLRSEVHESVDTLRSEVHELKTKPTTTAPAEVRVSSDTSSITSATVDPTSYASKVSTTSTGDGFTLVQRRNSNATQRQNTGGRGAGRGIGRGSGRGGRGGRTSLEPPPFSSSSIVRAVQSSVSFPLNTPSGDSPSSNNFFLKYHTKKRFVSPLSDDISPASIATMFNSVHARFAPSANASTSNISTNTATGAGDNIKFSGTARITTSSRSIMDDTWQFLLREGRLLSLSNEDTSRFNIPPMTSVFRYEVPPINAESYTVRGIVDGFGSKWIASTDFGARRRFAAEIVNAVLSNCSNALLEKYRDQVYDISSVFGIDYHDTVRGRGAHSQPLQVVSIVTSDNEEGIAFADALFRSASKPNSNDPITLTVTGGIKIRLFPFPEGDANVKIILKDCAKRTHILESKDTWVHRIENIDNTVLNEAYKATSTILYQIVATLPSCIGAVPTSRDGTKGNAGLALIFLQNDNVKMRNPSYYRDLVIQAFPSLDALTPSKPPDMIDLTSSSTNTTSCHLTPAEFSRAMDTSYDYNASDNGKKIFVGWGAGGLACIGEYPSYEGTNGAKSVVNGVPYCHYWSELHSEDGWTKMQSIFGEKVVDQASLRKYVIFKRCPLNQTNLDLDACPDCFNNKNLIGNTKHKRAFTYDPPNDVELHAARAKLLPHSRVVETPPGFTSSNKPTSQVAPPNKDDEFDIDSVVEATPLAGDAFVEPSIANDEDTDIIEESQELLSLPVVGPGVLPTDHSSPTRRKRDVASMSDITPTKKKKENNAPSTPAPTMVTSPTSIIEDHTQLPAVKFRVPPFTTRHDIEQLVTPLLSNRNAITHVIFSRTSNSLSFHPFFVVLTSKDPTVVSFLAQQLSVKELFNVSPSPIVMSEEDWSLIDEVQVSDHLETLAKEELVHYVKSHCTLPQQCLVAEHLSQVENGTSLMNWYLTELPSIGKAKSS